jgi:diguanylate cyclase (GGDEF)-like protein/PAS domain S-box-containing protein
MQALGARSILAVPIEVEGAYWGHIALENCRRPRAWAKREIDAVGILARVTGAVMTRRKAQDALAESEEQFRAVSDTVIDAIIMFRADGTVAYWNHAAERILGYTAAEAHGKSIADWMTPPRFRDESRRMMQAFTDPGHGPFSGTTFERAAIRKDGVEIAVELSISALSVGAQRYGVEVLRDITSRKAAEAAVVRMASHDALTGLPNRRFFIEALEHEIARAKRTGKLLAVLYLDLDRFKDVNDTLGHPIGDRLLQEVAARLRASMRAIDTIARFGGDEFAAMGIDIAAAADVGALARKIVAALGAPFAVDDRTIQTGASIGIAVYGPDSPDAESLLSHADIALYRAKGERRGTYRFYTEAMDAEVRARIAIDSQLTEAIARQQFVVMYQPQVAVDSGRIAGLEALVRWQHPTRGLIGPGEFIVAAERSGAIVALGRFVQTEACLQMQRWIDAGIAPPLIGVNVSGVQFKAPNELVDGITSVLAQSGLAPHLVELELTESVLMEASLEHSTALQHLREMGLRIAIDHFGTGYSSLDYLRRFRVDRIKIPGSFITDVCSDASVASIVRAAIGLARELEVELVVEGVETAEQLALLKGWGCRVVQGFYFSKPLDVDGATSLLRAGIVTPAKA